MEVVPFKAEHVRDMQMQDSQDVDYLGEFTTSEQARALEGDWSFTGVVNGVPIACAGVLPMWAGRGMAWAFISKEAHGNNFMSVHRAVKRFLDNCYLQRIEMTVDSEFTEGHRWAHMLGFTLECPRMRAYRPDGGDCALYARVR